MTNPLPILRQDPQQAAEAEERHQMDEAAEAQEAADDLKSISELCNEVARFLSCLDQHEIRDSFQSLSDAHDAAARAIAKLTKATS